jgi:hypothetical protein
LSNIPTLKIVDISNNYLSGVLPFVPHFELVGIETNLDLSLQIDLPAITESPTPQTISNSESSINLPLITGISAVSLMLIILVAAFVIRMILLKRRKEGKETEIELRLLPKYSSKNKQIRLMSKINSGGFGVVWKARYKGQTVAIKLIRMDKHEGKEYDNKRNVNTVKMVADESLVMGLMVHERIVRFIKFEIESLGIV